MTNVVCLLTAKNIQHEQNKTKRTACSVSSKNPAYLLELLHVSGRAKVILQLKSIQNQSTKSQTQRTTSKTKKTHHLCCSKKLLPLKVILKIFWFCFWWFSPCWHTFCKVQLVEFFSIQLKWRDSQHDFRHVGLPHFHLLR